MKLQISKFKILSFFIVALLLIGCGANRVGQFKKTLEVSKITITTWQEELAGAALDGKVTPAQETEIADLLDKLRDTHNEVVAAARVAESIPTEDNQKSYIELNSTLTDLAIRTIEISAKYGLILSGG
jgi:hypothetical protein